MRFKDALKESHVGGSFHEPGSEGHLDTGISPTGHVTGEYGENLLPVDPKLKKKRDAKKKKRKDSPNMNEDIQDEATTSTDVTGTDTPHMIDWYGPREKRRMDKKLVRRKFPKRVKLESNDEI